jgi:HAD superfamily hydrolase (TIGR01459 family)
VLKILNSLKKPVVLISNTPFLRIDCRKNLEQCGLPAELYQTVLTAGDLCFEYIQNEYKIAKKVYLIDTHYWGKWQEISNLHSVTDNIHEADVILALAVPHAVKDPKDIALHYDEIFKQAIKRNLKFICANPDLLAFCSKKQHLRPGLLSQRYQQLGGEVLSFGKPFPEIFTRALKQLKYPDRVPVIIKKNSNDKILQDIDKERYLIPKNLNLSEIIFIIRKRINIDPKQAIFLFVGKGVLVPLSQTIGYIYEQYHSDDNFLYMVYTTENTFG